MTSLSTITMLKVRRYNLCKLLIAIVISVWLIEMDSTGGIRRVVPEMKILDSHLESHKICNSNAKEASADDMSRLDTSSNNQQ